MNRMQFMAGLMVLSMVCSLMADAPETSKLVRKRYSQAPILPEFGCYPGEPEDRDFTLHESAVKSFFEREGIAFPDGSDIFLEPASLTFTVVNTEENHKRINQVLRECGIPFCQVEVNALIVGFPHKMIDKLLRKGADHKPSARSILQLYESGSGELLHAFSLLTRPGINVEEQAVYERRYVSDFSIVPTGQTQEGDTANSIIAIQPEEFVSRKVGAILNLTPTVSFDYTLIDVTLIFELCRELPDKEIRITSNISEKTTGISVCQPVFQSFNITTSLILKDGIPTGLGGWNDEENNTIIYLVLTATLIDPEGRPFIEIYHK